MRFKESIKLKKKNILSAQNCVCGIQPEKKIAYSSQFALYIVLLCATMVGFARNTQQMRAFIFLISCSRARDAPTYTY